jgi:hypothetical protein
MPTKPDAKKADEAEEATGSVARSLAEKLAAFVPTLPEEEQALFQHVLLSAVPTHQRYRYVDEDELLSSTEQELLESLKTR